MPLLQVAKAEISRILEAPLLDPDAPEGFCRPEFAARESARRFAEASAAIERMIYAIEDRHGAKTARLVRAHLAALMKALPRSK